VNVVGLIASLWLLAPVEAVVAAPSTTPQPAPAPAQAQAPKAEILGIWKGTSTCTKVEINEFCHDETVVYNFVDVPEQPGTVELKAARIVDNSVKPVYWLYVSYRPEEGRWTSEFERPQVRGIWSYVVHGDDLKGTATVLPTLTVVRNVEAKRVSKDQVLAP
jgi:hypothetical protein